MATMVLAGCVTNWQPQQAPPAQLIEATGETRVQVRLASGIRVVLRDPGIEGDSLVGWQLTKVSTGADAPVRRAFALTDVQQLATRGNNVAPNVILGAATGFAVFVASVVGIYLIVCAAGCD
jgi:hypothetical protein